MIRILIFLSILNVNSIFLFAQENKFYQLEFVYGNSELDSFYNDNISLLPSTVWIKQIAFNLQISVGKDAEVLSYNFENLNIDFELAVTTNEREVIYDSLINNLTRITKMTDGLWLRAELNGQYVVDTMNKLIVIDYKNIIKRDVKGYNNIRDVMSVYIQFFMLYYNNGVKKLSQGKPFIASKLFRESIKLESKYADSWYNLGVSEFQIGNKESACKAWETCSYFDNDCKELFKNKCENKE